MCVCTHTHADTQSRTRTHARTHARTHIHPHVRTRTYARIHTHTRTRTHLRTHTHAYKCTHTHARTRARTPNDARAHTFFYIWVIVADNPYSLSKKHHFRISINHTYQYYLNLNHFSSQGVIKTFPKLQ